MKKWPIKASFVKAAMGETAGDDEIEFAILAYLQQRPRAADTLRGIVNWWLPRQRYETASQRIEHALGEMVARGVLSRDRLPDGAMLYTLKETPRH